MRRHVFLMIVIAALIAAVAMLRPRLAVQAQVEAPPAAEPRIEPPSVDVAHEHPEFEEPAPAPVSPVAARKDT